MLNTDVIAPVLEHIITIVCAVLASSGFWAFMQKHSDKHDAKTQLLVGLAHDRIMSLGNAYIRRKYITPEEYENLRVYLYDPYSKNGGNGSAKHMMEIIDTLPLRPNGSVPEDEMIF